MPKYTATFTVTRRGKFVEEVMLDGIRASSERMANNIACQQAYNYIKTHDGGKNAPDGYTITMCARTDLLDSKKVKLKSDPTELVLIENNKPVGEVMHVKFSSKFKDEERGGFWEALSFRSELVPRELPIITAFGPKGNGY